MTPAQPYIPPKKCQQYVVCWVTGGVRWRYCKVILESSHVRWTKNASNYFVQCHARDPHSRFNIYLLRNWWMSVSCPLWEVLWKMCTLMSYIVQKLRLEDRVGFDKFRPLHASQTAEKNTQFFSVDHLLKSFNCELYPLCPVQKALGLRRLLVNIHTLFLSHLSSARCERQLCFCLLRHLPNSTLQLLV